MTYAQEQIFRRTDHWDDQRARVRRKDGGDLPQFKRQAIDQGSIAAPNGISDATFYKYKSKVGGMTVSDARRLKTLEAENSKLKRLLAEQM